MRDRPFSNSRESKKPKGSHRGREVYDIMSKFIVAVRSAKRSDRSDRRLSFFTKIGINDGSVLSVVFRRRTHAGRMTYGVAPADVLPKLMDLKIEGTDLTHILRAVMGLYLGMIVLWLMGAFRLDVTRAAVISEIFFMLGLASGRLLSITVDGVPSIPLIIYTIVEIALGLWGIWVLTTQIPKQQTLTESVIS